MAGVKFKQNDPKKWMKEFPDQTPLSALSIPGTHNSPTCHTALPSVRCQAVSPIEQLENGVRFFDIRVQVAHPEDKKSDKLRLVHSVFPISLVESKKFRPLYDEILGFLRKNPSETVILSLKREGSGDATDADLAQKLWDHYIEPKHWVMDSGIPTLGHTRGKVVLFRRFKLNEAMKKLYGQATGINAQNWADNTANSKGGDVQIQDFYEVSETDNIEMKKQYVCEHCDRATQANATLTTAGASVGDRASGPMFINFLSASNFWKPGCWPDKVAGQINPAVVKYLSKKGDKNSKQSPRGGIGVLVMDWVGENNNWDLVSTYRNGLTLQPITGVCCNRVSLICMA